MKLIIDIDEEIYKKCKWKNNGVVGLEWWESAIASGTPIPDNATNGEVVKTMFPDAEIHLDGNDVFIHHIGFWIKCNIRWWNAPYQKGGTNRKNCEYRHENGNCLKVGGFCMSVDDEHCVKGGKE